MAKPVFSGHESFACKSHWLKRGYDFVNEGNNFNADDAVVQLGVGKNMVSSIRFWMRSFGVLDANGTLTPIAHYLLDSDTGCDPFFEDPGSLWLMHFLLIETNYATVYPVTFIEYHRQRNLIDKSKLQNFIKHSCFENSQYKNLYNENTVKRDIGVMIHNYCGKSNGSLEDSNALLAPLNLVQESDKKDVYTFNSDTRSLVPPRIFLYAMLSSFSDRKSVSFDEIAKLGLIFCLTNNEMLELIKQLCSIYSDVIVFSDVAGIKELQFKGNLTKDQALADYYRNE